MTATQAPSLVSDLKRITAPDRVISDPSELYVYDCDGFTIARSTPGAVVFPINTDEVVAIVRLLAERDVQIVPRGSGTGNYGQAMPLAGGMLDSAERKSSSIGYCSP